MTEYTLSRNPANGLELARYPFHSATQVECLLQSSYQRQQQWRDTPLKERVGLLKKLAEGLHSESEALSRMMSLEMGKPIIQAKAEVNKCVDVCLWYAEHGPALLAPQPTKVEDNKAWQTFNPLGVILAVMPWNFPYWQVLRGAVGMILAGNTYVLKHAPNVMGCAQLLANVFDKAGLPEGIFTLLNIDNAGVSSVIKDNRIAAIAVTGSANAGAAIAAQAGAVVKKTLLELGGSDPFIVLADANLDQAVNSAILGRFQNTGQVCMAAKRFIIEAPVAAAFEQKFIAAVAKLKSGDPLDPETFIGPMARGDLRDELDKQVQQSLALGARLCCGGQKQPGDGYYYQPTVLADVTEQMPVFQQEVFGPVAALMTADNPQHALELANNSDYGLSATIWTASEQQAEIFADKLETGAVFINGNGASDPRVTIGGVKKSGYGRELNYFGLHEFCNIKTVWRDRR